MADEILPRVRSLCRPGVVVDAGANLGVYSAELLNAENCNVIAFEPLIGAFLMLCHEMARLGGDRFPPNLMLYNVALGDSFTVATLNTPIIGGELDHQMSSITKDFADRSLFPADKELQVITQSVVVAPLDAFRFQPLTLLKIDVEGAELEVIRGARETIARSRPIIVVEIEERHRAGSTYDVPAFLAGMGYRGFFFFEGRFVDFDRFERATMQAPMVWGFHLDPYVNNFVFVHGDDAWALSKLASL